MSEHKMLIGSLSNDLGRVATLSHRGSYKAAEKFWKQAQMWVNCLKSHQNKPYIENIINTLAKEEFNPKDSAKAEKNLMYSILLQNYTLSLE